MEFDIKKYDEQKNGIKKYMNHLDTECKKIYGENFYYKYGSKNTNPYTKFLDEADFKKRAVGKMTERTHIDRHCHPNYSVTIAKDNNKRYYSEINTEQQCARIRGIWDKNAINRDNKYDQGVCWVSAEDKMCSDEYDGKYLRPNQAKYRNVRHKMEEQSEKCNENPSCEWKNQSKFTFDCVKKTDGLKKKDKDAPIMSPPKNMPLENDLEKYLHEWYIKKKHGKPPTVGKLIGTGNRCANAAASPTTDIEINKGPKDLRVEYINYRQLNPFKAHDAELISAKLGGDFKRLNKYKEEWTELQEEGGFNRWTHLRRNNKLILPDFYAKMDKEQFEANSPIVKAVEIKKRIKKDEDGEEEEEEELPFDKKFPSVPQSVINMVMKQVAQMNSKKRGLLAWHSTGSGKCHGWNSPILMHDGSIKKVQDIEVGELLMGDDSLPRTVLSLASGVDEMYDIIPNTGDKYTVNSEHILCLKDEFEIVHEMTVKSFLALDKHTKDNLKGYRVSIDFIATDTGHDPYEIGRSLENLSNIPREYKVNSRNIRLLLLAGLIDSYGSIHGNYGYEIKIYSTSVCREDILFLARSLGFCAFNNGENSVILYGDGLNDIPLRIQTYPSTRIKNSLLTNICAQSIGRDNYYGFTLDGNNRYLIGDFTVTHNTATATGIMDAFWDTNRPIIFASSVDAIRSNKERTFHELAYDLFPRFQQGEYVGGSRSSSIDLIGAAFNRRNIKFLSFAKLAHRVETAIEYKAMHAGARKKTNSEKPVKNCPPGKIQNPLTGRCINIKGEKAIKPEKTVKNCPPGKIQNPLTGRCIKGDKAIETEPDKPVKNCPPGKIQNPITGRCIKGNKAIEPEPEKVAKPDKLVKNCPPGKIQNPLTGRCIERDKEIELEPEKPAKPEKRATQKPQKEKNEDILHGKNYVDLENAVLIIDEVHNLFRPLPNQQKEHRFLEDQILDPKVHPNLKVVILTATPGDNIDDVVKLLNIVRNMSNPPIQIPNLDKEEGIKKFKNEIRGLVSFFDYNGDLTKFPILDDDFKFIKAPMGPKQLEKYIEAYKKVTSKQKDFEGLAENNEVSKYWEPVRKYSNQMLNFENGFSLSDFSSKMPYLINNIEKYPNDKQYCYSAFYANVQYGQGVIAIGKELVKRGYKQLTYIEAKRFNKLKKLPPPAKRFFIAISTQIGGDSDASENLGQLLSIYNSPENKDGSLIHVMLASQKYNESIDLKAVRHIHIFEPLVTMASDLQAIGRAVRFCSFKDLEYEKWVVKVHRYISTVPTTISLNVEPQKQKIQQEVNELEVELDDLKETDGIKEVQAELRNKKKELKKNPGLKDEVNILEMKIETIKARAKNSKAIVAEISKRIKDKNKELNKLSKPPKYDLSQIESIDEKIFKESRERFKHLLIIYKCMREAAIDCQLLKKFHSKSNKIIECEF